MPFEIIRNDITKMKVDAIVCNGNSKLIAHDGVCGQVFLAAGPELTDACRKTGGCDSGGAVVTLGFNLPAKYIIHTVGPHWNGGNSGEDLILRCCYQNVMNRAKELHCSTLAIPLIASGNYHYPKDEALRIAHEEILTFLLKYDTIKIFLVVFGKAAYLQSTLMFPSVVTFINDNYVENHIIKRESVTQPVITSPTIEGALSYMGKSFKETLLELIDRTGQKDSMVYRKANISKGVFYKIKNIPNYKPSKNTALAFAVALQLNVDETNDLLKAIGSTLSHSDKSDIIVEYFISNGNYNIFDINIALFDFGEKQLGS